MTRPEEQIQRAPPVDYILGIDPGLSGAMAFLACADYGMVTAEDAPVAGDAINAALMADRIMQLRPTVCVIELVGAMPGQGVSSMFKFGRAFGTAIGIVAALDIPIHYVTPAKWKAHFRLPKDKDAARQRAINFWPASADRFTRKKDAGRAEAALIARYGLETLPQFQTMRVSA